MCSVGGRPGPGLRNTALDEGMLKSTYLKYKARSVAMMQTSCKC